MDVVSILQIGVVGLGFLLAFLAYKLLTQEQNRHPPRNRILLGIYVFMFFSVCLVILGGTFKAVPEWLEYLRSSDATLLKKLDKRNTEYDVLKEENKKLSKRACGNSECITSDGKCGRVRVFAEIYYAEGSQKGEGGGLEIDTTSADGVMVDGSGMSSSTYNGDPRIKIRAKWACE